MEVPRDERPSTRAEQTYLTAGAAFLAGAVALFLADTASAFDAPFGLYPILACLAIGGACGWQAGACRRESREARREQRMESLRQRAQLAELIEEVRELRRQVAAARPAGHMYVSSAAQSVGIVRAPVDADTVGALERINLRLIRGGDS